MKTITIKEGCSTPVNIGEKGENGVGAVLFDYSEWLNDFGNGAISLLVKRKGDTAAYPVVLTTADGIATWTISDIDTAVQGYGKAEYVFTIDDKIAKSAVFSFFVAQDLGAAGDPPDPYESWIDTLTALGGETLINAQAAQTAQEAAETAQASAETAATNAESSATAAAQSAGAARFAAESALASADSASASATAASGHATAAESAKDLAISAAEDAQHSETQAELSASAAAEEAELAQTAATNAQQSATNAATSATQSANNAAQAIEAASDAEEADRIATNAATSATQSASNAATSASAASVRATAAAQSASSASDSATSANESAERAETAAASVSAIQLPVDTASGAIASFPDGASGAPVEALTVSLDPVQDLHGQSAPYPPNGGANKWDEDWEVGIYNANTGLPESSTGNIRGKNPISVSASTAYYAKISGGGTVRVLYYDSTDTFISSETKQNAAFTTPSNASFVRISTINYGLTYNNNIAINYPSTVTTYSPYSNICPITGHTAVEVWRSGINILDEQVEHGTINNTTGALADSPTLWRSANLISIVPNTTYYFNSVNGKNCLAYFYDSDMNYLGYEDNMGNAHKSYTVPDKARFMRLRLFSNVTQYNVGDFSVNYPSSDHDYHTYTAQHISIPLSQTVYGGSIDVVGGVCIGDWNRINLADYAASMFNNGIRDNNQLVVLSVTGKKNGAANILSDQFFYGTSTEGRYTMHGRAANTAVEFEIPLSALGLTPDDPQATRLAAARQWIVDNQPQLCYELETPITIDLSDIPTISTLLGQNNIWSDSGDVAVEYRADIQRYIQKMIAEALA